MEGAVRMLCFLPGRRSVVGLSDDVSVTRLTGGAIELACLSNGSRGSWKIETYREELWQAVYIVPAFRRGHRQKRREQWTVATSAAWMNKPT